METTIPDKNRPEWREMIMGETEIEFHNYVLQMQVTQMRRLVKYNQLSYEEALDKIYTLCNKYALAVQTDFKKIFKTW